MLAPLELGETWNVREIKHKQWFGCIWMTSLLEAKNTVWNRVHLVDVTFGGPETMVRTGCIWMTSPLEAKNTVWNWVHLVDVTFGGQKPW